MLKIKKIIVGPVETNCYLISLNNELAVVDPGDEYEKIEAEIEKLGEVKHKYILLTHGHFDHVLAVNQLKEKYGFEVAIGEKDRDISGINLQIGAQVPEIKADITLKEGQALDLGGQKIQVIETPGHTVGSVSCLIGDNLFSGDTLFHHSHGRTDLPGGSDEDMKNSLKKLFALSDQTKVFPGHYEETTLGEAKKHFRKSGLDI